MNVFTATKKLTVTALVFLASISSGIAQPPEYLFTNLPESVNPGFHGVAAHAASVDIGLISRGTKNIKILLPDGTEAQLVRDGFEKRGPGDVAWRGRVANATESSVTLTLQKGWVFGQIQIDERIYEIKPMRGGKVVIEELDTESFPACGNHEKHLTDIGAAKDRSGEALAFDSPTPAAATTGVIDLLSVYTPQARTAAGGTSQMEAHIQAAVDATNTAFISSSMNVHFRLVHTAEVAYNDTGELGADLDWVSNNTAVASLRDQYGADMVSLLVKNGGNYCGIGYVQNNPGSSFASWAFQVTDMDCAVGNLTFAHEHGHNMGMEHNPENGPSPDSASYPHSFAHYIDGSYRTVMSYSNPCNLGCTRAALFSNPDIIHNDHVSGITGERHNALTGDFTGPIIADFRTEVLPLLSADTRFAVIGDYGSDDADFDERDVADLVASWLPDFVITAGDNRYSSISMDAAVGKYYCDFLTDAGSGTHCSGGNATTNTFFPSLGNHDVNDGGGRNEYLNYFTLPGDGIETTGTSGNENYYDFVQGSVHFFVVDSTNSSSFNTQKAWLQQQLAASTTPWQVVYFHHSPYSSGNHGSNTSMQWPFASWGADAVISGHDHTYERLEINGIPYFVNGLGGRSRYDFGTPVAGSIVRYRDNYGAMLVDASDTAMTFQFINVDGAVIDTYTIEPGSGGVLDVRVTQSSDDAEELIDPNPTKSFSTGHVNLTSTDLEMVNDDSWHGGDQMIGIRFQNVGIPQGATILSAYLEFATDEADSVFTTIDIQAQDNDDAVTFSTTAYNISSRPSTLTSVSWTINDWSTIGKLRTSPDLTAVVQEVVDRSGWTANNSMAFLITGSGVRTTESFDGNPASAPLLHVEYDTQPVNQAPSAAFNYVTNDLMVNFTDASTDSDGSIVSWLWDFGDDGIISDFQNPSHAYATAGTYSVELTVTDNSDTTDSTINLVTVSTATSQPPAAPTNLTAVVEQSGKGRNKVITGIALNWTDNSNNETEFVVEGCTKSGKGRNKTCLYGDVALIEANVTNFTVELSLEHDHFRVKAVNDVGSSTWSNEVKI
jgi:hypothetical protein